MEARRLKNTKEYYFSLKLKEIAEMKAQGLDVINLGIGSPDLQPSEIILDELAHQVHHGNNQYQSYWGLPELRKAILDFYKIHFNVEQKLNEVVPLMGSKEGIMLISLAFLNTGDTVLVPNPGYPTYTSVSQLVEAKIINYSLNKEKLWQPDFEELNKLLIHKPKLMWLNYPNMPTGAYADENLFKKLVEWARSNGIILVNDNPYSFILNPKPISLLKFSKNQDNVLELNSLSKTFNIAGWRIGMVLGNSNLIKAIMKVKSNIDSGMYFGLQKAAIKALSLDNTWFESLNKAYKKRRALVWEICDALSLRYEKKSAGMFVLGKINQKNNDDLAFSKKILDQHHVFLTPASIFGSQTKGYIRISLCEDEEKILTALNRIKS